MVPIQASDGGRQLRYTLQAKGHRFEPCCAHPHLESPESRKKSKRKYRISCYGLTQDDFDLLLKIQGYACGMCRDLLLCHGCNIALGHIEHRYAMARAYLDGPRPWAALRA